MADTETRGGADELVFFVNGKKVNCNNETCRMFHRRGAVDFTLTSEPVTH